MKRCIALALFLLCLLQAPSALAYYTVAFTDEVNYWPGFNNNRWDPYLRDFQDNLDVIGSPKLTGGNFVYSGHTLTGIELNYESTSRELVPGDWFFDLDQDGSWDYVLHHILCVGYDGRVNWDGGYALFSVDLAYLGYTDDSWMEDYRASFWPWGYEGRFDHPVQALVDREIWLESVTFSGWEQYLGWNETGTSTWSDFALDLSGYSGTFTYAFAMTCGNDVLFGESTIPAPEPSTFILFGLGGLGVVCYARRKRRSL